MIYKIGDKIFCANITELKKKQRQLKRLGVETRKVCRCMILMVTGLKSKVLGCLETTNLQDIAEIIERCEDVQNSTCESAYTKQQAKVYAYNRIVEELGFRRNC